MSDGDGGLSILCHLCLLVCQQRLLKTFPRPVYRHYKDEVVWLLHFLVNFHLYGQPFYLATTQSQCLMVIEIDGGLNTLCHLFRLVCQQRVLKAFLSPVYLHYKDEVVWLWHLLINLHLYDPPFYLPTTQSQCLMVIGGDGGLSNLRHSRRFSCHQKVLYTFPGTSYLH